MIDYTIFYKKLYADNASLKSDNNWDLLISAFNSNQRVSDVFNLVTSTEKHWLISPEFNFSASEIPPTVNNIKSHILLAQKDTTNYFKNYFNTANLSSFKKICVDITGFTRPNLILFVRMLYKSNIKKFDLLYSEPSTYKNQENTKFSDLPNEPLPIPGCSRINPDNSNNLLILASGYDFKLISKVASAYKSCKTKCQIFGLPSLQPDMYHENRFTANKASDSLGEDVCNYFAPANDPFVTAQVIQEIVKEHTNYTNLYLSPLSTKAQTLGFILYYIFEGINKNVTIVFPYSEKYYKQTSDGYEKTWKYSLELP